MPAATPSSRALSLTGLDLKEYLAGLERDLIEKALDDSRGVVTRAADRLGIGRTTLVEKMRKYKLPRLGDESHEQQGQDEDKDVDSEHARFSDPASRLQ
jgi:DNA-binding NtrC family response regulator